MPSFPPHTGYSFPGVDNLHHDIYPEISVSSTRGLHQPGKVVLITGAGRGIGRAIALQYAHASASAIILCARTGPEIDQVEKEVKKIDSSIRVHKYLVSVSDSDAVARLAQDVTSKEGRLDVLINNAGASSEWARIADCGVDSWWNAMEVNLKGPFLFIHALIPLLAATAEKSGKSVHVINVNSIGAHTLIPGSSSAYGISKLAALRLTEYVDAEYAGQGVVALGLHPGGVETELSKQYDAVKPFLIDTPELCGGFAVWFTAESRSWLAGRYVSATWDVSALEGMKDEIVTENKLKVFMKV